LRLIDLNAKAAKQAQRIAKRARLPSFALYPPPFPVTKTYKNLSVYEHF
jgi:hypothetical protein